MNKIFISIVLLATAPQLCAMEQKIPSQSSKQPSLEEQITAFKQDLQSMDKSLHTLTYSLLVSEEGIYELFILMHKEQQYPYEQCVDFVNLTKREITRVQEDKLIIELLKKYKIPVIDTSIPLESLDDINTLFHPIVLSRFSPSIRNVLSQAYSQAYQEAQETSTSPEEITTKALSSCLHLIQD